MEKTLSVQPLASQSSAIARAQRTPAAAPSSTDPPVRRAISGFKPLNDSVSISNEARRMEANPPRGNNDRLQGPRAANMPERAMQALGELKESFFTKEGDEGFNARVDFNSDGVINVQDLGVLREKMASYAQPVTPPAEPEAEPDEVATLQSIRDSFFTQEGEDGFDAASDLNGDGVVNFQDLGLFRSSQGDTAEPVQPVPAALTADNEAVATSTAAPPIQNVASEPDASAVIDDPAPAAVNAGVNALAIDPDTVGLATSANAGTAPALDVASIRESLLDQLRNAFFSRAGDDRFDATLDGNGDGRINFEDFTVVRDRV